MPVGAPKVLLPEHMDAGYPYMPSLQVPTQGAPTGTWVQGGQVTLATAGRVAASQTATQGEKETHSTQHMHLNVGTVDGVEHPVVMVCRGSKQMQCCRCSFNRGLGSA
jgi:hypothetical protein